MLKNCAFCGQRRKLTKEHVWPRCFMNRVGKGNAHYSPKSGQVHGADYVVRDVCSQCNNNCLTELDDYFCDLYDQYFSFPRGSDEEVILKYDYDLLCRVLLKVAYNTARSARSDCAPFQNLLTYILHGNSCPDGVALIVELVSPTYISDTGGSIAMVRELKPRIYRSAQGQLLTPHGSAVLVRVVAVNSFFFHLLLARDSGDLQSFEIAKTEFLAGVQGSVLLVPEAGIVRLRSSPQDGLSSMFPLLRAKREQYRRFFDRQKKSDQSEGG